MLIPAAGDIWRRFLNFIAVKVILTVRVNLSIMHNLEIGIRVNNRVVPNLGLTVWLHRVNPEGNPNFKVNHNPQP